MSNSVEYIDNVEKLNGVCEYIRNNIDLIGIDTEFIRQNTYYPILCLIQVIYFKKNTNNYKTIVIDTVEIKNISSFIKILKNNKIKKVFFSFNQDIDAFSSVMKGNIKNIDDIQIMLEFCGYESNMSYANCVKKISNTEFNKNKNLQVSNWIKRPLTKKQIEYASNDVHYLIEIYNYLLDIIKKNNNYNYYLDEIKHIIKFKNTKYIINNSWKKLKFNLHKKNISYVLLLKELCKWREKESIKLNKIRGYIIDDYSLEMLAINKPKTMKELSLIYVDNLNLINLKKEYKKDILEIINNFLVNYDKIYKNDIFYTSEKGFPDKGLLVKKYNEISNLASKLNISIARVVNKMDVISIIMKYERKKNILYGWKYNLFKDVFN